MKCSLKGCDSTDAVWSPVIVLYAPKSRGKHDPVRAQLGLHICQKHKEESTLADFLSDEGFQQISDSLTSIGRASPDRSRAKLEWEIWAGSPLQQHRSGLN